MRTLEAREVVQSRRGYQAIMEVMRRGEPVRVRMSMREVVD